MDLVLYAVPCFFLLIAFELGYDRIKRANTYRVNDSLTSLATGVINQLVNVLGLLVPLTLYVVVFDRVALTHLPQSVWVWLLAFVLYDLCYYWNHRLGHEMNVLWAAHVVHHSSEEYNLTTALRQTGTGLISAVFYLPLAVLGFDPLMIVSIGAINLIYQFWVHTQHVSKLGWFDYVFLSPSNHRVHHAQNKVYIDRNYGGVFMFWDHLFGSFQAELDEEPVVFGIRGALNSWNPLWANVHVYAQLAQDAIHTDSWWHKFTIWFRRTGWRPPDVVLAYPLVKTDLQQPSKFDTTLSEWLTAHCIIQYIVTAAMALSLIMSIETLDMLIVLLGVAWILISLFSIGALMENKAYARWLELARIVGLLTVVVANATPLTWSVPLYMACLSAVFLLWKNNRWQDKQSQSQQMPAQKYNVV